MAHQPTLKQLKYLCAIADTRHFGQAAQACHISQSTLSAALQDLEECLETTLVERSNKRVILTPTGEDVVTRAREILTGVCDLVDACTTSREPLSGKMRMGVIPTIAPYILPELLNRLRETHKSFRLYLREDLSGRLVSALLGGELDILLMALPYPAENTETMHLFYDDFLLAFNTSHPIRSQRKLKTEDLRGQDLLLLEDGHCLRDHALDACKLKPDNIAIPYQAASLNTLVQMVANDIGITLLPQMAVSANILTGTEVKTRHFDEKNIWRSIGLMWRKKTPRRTEFKLLGDFIKNQVAKKSAR